MKTDTSNVKFVSKANEFYTEVLNLLEENKRLHERVNELYHVLVSYRTCSTEEFERMRTAAMKIII